MLGRARKARSRARTDIELLRACAESLPLPDRSADVLVLTLVLCSVPDPDAVLAEARRVLRSGGALLFIEHVRSSDRHVAASQDRWDRRWARFAEDRHPTAIRGTPANERASRRTTSTAAIYLVCGSSAPPSRASSEPL